MKVLIFSDIHGDARSLERAVSRPADIYISAGDLSTFGRGLGKLGEIMKPLGERLWVLPGNHETENESRDFCGKFGFFDFHRQVREAGGKTWAGLGYSNPTPFDTPGEYSEEEIAEALGAFHGLPKLQLVVHFPPQGTRLDEVSAGKHAGSRVLREWVEREQPEWLFCGHIHECTGKTDRIGRTQCVNVGKAGYLAEI